MLERSTLPESGAASLLPGEKRAVPLEDRQNARPELEQRILLAFAERRQLTLGQLRSITGCSPEDLRSALHRLRKRGEIRRLNTVVESYCPGVPPS
jgi:hypothetical protein